MINIDENILEIKKYLKKLLLCISSETVFNMGDTKLVKKARIDDLLCCIEASIPQEFKKYGQKIGAKKLKSNQAWAELNTALKKKFFLSGDLYIISNKDVIGTIQVLQKTFEPDLRFVFSEESGMTF